MDATGILPAYTGTVVSDALCAYRQYRQSRYALCGAHLLRELTYIKEACSGQQWTEPLAKLLLEIKAAGKCVRTVGGYEIGQEQHVRFFRRYDRVVARASRLNPPASLGFASRERGATPENAEDGPAEESHSGAREAAAGMSPGDAALHDRPLGAVRQ